ncbi:phytanoyl dioxygenase family [Fusarium denticulatum]|uniref:Phytanoyl dioxygenase family n=1 Tax=Fusarium denticulatum TaxID=48507 RepID=A0A8H5TBV6_9HYPO|nr:phytanoyl dioxygenase family [Fusarium denticulatum]
MPNPAHQRNNPEITALPATAPIEEIVSVIRRDGGIIIKNFITPEEADRIQAEADPHYQKVGKYEGTLFPPTDPPLSGFAGKSPTFAHKAINHPVYREASKLLLKEESYPFRDGKRYKCVSNPVLAVSEAFSRGRSKAQPLHRDDMAQHFDHVEGSGESSLLGLLVAGTKCTFENGATQVIVGSHLWPEAAISGPADRSMCSTAEMEKGDAVMIIGSVWHGAGANITDERRNIFSCHMVRGSYRADENQYLAIPREVIKDYDPEVQSLLGYSVSHPNCGHVDMKDPIVMLGSNEDPFGYGSIQGQVVA